MEEKIQKKIQEKENQQQQQQQQQISNNTQDASHSSKNSQNKLNTNGSQNANNTNINNPQQNTQKEKQKTKATNQKNTYIKKISTLMEKHANTDKAAAVLPEIGEEKPKRNKQPIGNEEEMNKDQIKLARNRESARNSRKRKKIYLELLENKTVQLNNFLAESKQINENSQQLLSDLENQIKSRNDLSNHKQILFRNMQMALGSNAMERDIKTIIESLKKKFGTVNKDRMEVLDYCYKQISEQTLPIHMQYILYCCKNKKDIFEEATSKNSNILQPGQDNQDEEDPENNEFPNIIKNLNFSESQKAKCKKLAKSLTKEKSKMDQMLTDLMEVKEKMKDELQSLDNTFEELRKDFAPSITGKFLMEIEKFQYTKNMKASFNKFFSPKANQIDLNSLDRSDYEDDSLDEESDGKLYEFIKSEDSQR
ncbi:hypothetical protein PPERSA_05512 [Pseudocohnilembus persalinus]|uniref:BZIP domain-containing protein n=1 Tax=Pseudocohnilembus persalinus TaxID=266149 RepID=A0A0V0QCQ7_PSEPJ|nr:hypothetical protein PPERSA_05512 [Pseudocohnilembus persalinus]|eukprot:KRX00010.1 hypothetical protein PPERSA_05512 [Pseudocohnilembus persalinus]